MTTQINIAGRPAIGPGLPAYVIAEIGTNHNRDLDTAEQMLRALAATGCDCAKFQIYEPDEIVSGAVRAADYGLDTLYGDISAREMFERHLKTPKEWFPHLRELCHGLGMRFGATIHGRHGLAWARQAGLDLVKIASMDHTNLPFLRSLVNAVDAPVLISFGMAGETDVEAALAALSGHRAGVGLFHCCAVYPPEPDELRLGNIAWLARRHRLPTGFSDHSTDAAAAIQARRLGALIFEKHVTLDRRQPGPDHPFAMEMDAFGRYVQTLRALPAGRPETVPAAFAAPAPREMDNRHAYVKSVIVRSDLPAGHVLGPDDLYLARPGTGIAPRHLDELPGRVLVRDVAAEHPLQWDDLDAARR